MFLFIFDSFIHFLYLSIVLSYIIFNIHTQITFDYNNTRNTQHCIHSFKFTHSPYHCVSILSVYSLSILSTRYHHQPHTYRSNQIKIQKKNELNEKTKLKPNRKQTKNTKKSNKLRSNQAVFMVGVSRYLIAVDSWLRSRHHHRYLCRRP